MKWNVWRNDLAGHGFEDWISCEYSRCRKIGGETITDKEKMINEAVKRMRLLGLLDLQEESVIGEFQENHEVFVSKPLNLGELVGVLYKLSDAEKRLVEKIEKTEKILVYHVIRNETNVGVMYAMLSVSRYEGDWKTERKALENMEAEVVYPLAYVWNVGMGEEDLLEGFGEWGTIAIIRGEEGLCRIFESHRMQRKQPVVGSLHR